MPNIEPIRFLADEDVPVALAHAINKIANLDELELC